MCGDVPQWWPSYRQCDAKAAHMSLGLSHTSTRRQALSATPVASSAFVPWFVPCLHVARGNTRVRKACPYIHSKQQIQIRHIYAFHPSSVATFVSSEGQQSQMSELPTFPRYSQRTSADV